MISERINETTPWQDITEGNKIFEAATSKEFCTGNGAPLRRSGMRKYVSSVFCAHLSVRILPFRSVNKSVRILITTIARAAAFAPRYAPLVRSP